MEFLEHETGLLSENNFRLQQCGWRDVYEYRSVHDEPEVWKHSGFVSKIYQALGFITYWSNDRVS